MCSGAKFLVGSGLDVSVYMSILSVSLFPPPSPLLILCDTCRADQPTGVDWPINEGMSCLAPGLGDYLSRENSTCTMGGLSQYIVNVTNGKGIVHRYILKHCWRINRSTVAQIQLAINFARNQNLRLVVRNSGHDFNAKSTGAGALSVWTHYLNDIQFLGENYQSRNGLYSVPAFKVGAGVSVEQINEAADAQGLMVVGGIARVSLFGSYLTSYLNCLYT